jgi:hypothetical protein
MGNRDSTVTSYDNGNILGTSCHTLLCEEN